MNFLKKQILCVSLFLYFLLSFFFFGFHTLFHLKTRFIGGGADPTIYIWAFAWYAHTLVSHASLFFSKAAFYPIGANLTQVTVIPGLALLFSPVTLFFGPVVSYNLCAIFLPGLAAWTAFLLCRYITKSDLASFFAGYFYGFSCYMIAQSSGHLNLIAPGVLIPVLILTLLYRLSRKITTVECVCWMTLWLTLLFSIEIEIFLTFVFCAILCFLLALLFFKEQRLALLSLIKPVFIASVLTCLILSPFFFFFFHQGESSSILPSVSDHFANRLIDFVVPSGIFLIKTALKVYDGSEFNGYIGIGGLLILFFYAIQQWKKIETKYLLSAFFLLVILSMGQGFQIKNGVLFYFPWQGLFKKMPLFSSVLPCRISMYISLVFSIVVAYWFSSCSWRLAYRFLLIFCAWILLLPAFSEKHRQTYEDIYMPRFFLSGNYQHYLNRGDHVLILPYRFGPEMLWQAQLNFPFHLIGGFLGVPPSLYNDSVVFNALGHHVEKNITIDQLKTFYQKFHATYVLVVDDADYQKWLKSGHYQESLNIKDYASWVPLIKKSTQHCIYYGEVMLCKTGVK